MTDARNANHRKHNQCYYTKDDEDDTAQPLHCYRVEPSPETAHDSGSAEAGTAPSQQHCHHTNTMLQYSLCQPPPHNITIITLLSLRYFQQCCPAPKMLQLFASYGPTIKRCDYCRI